LASLFSLLFSFLIALAYSIGRPYSALPSGSGREPHNNADLHSTQPRCALGFSFRVYRPQRHVCAVARRPKLQLDGRQKKIKELDAGIIPNTGAKVHNDQLRGGLTGKNFIPKSLVASPNRAVINAILGLQRLQVFFRELD